MSSIYARKNRLWCRIKGDRWVSQATPFLVGQEAEAREFAAAEQAKLIGRSFLGADNPRKYGGQVYAIAMVPDLDIRRLKVGYTARPIQVRFDTYLTSNPTAKLLGLWSVPLLGEEIALRALKGRIGGTEVFHVPDVQLALVAIDDALRSRWP